MKLCRNDECEICFERSFASYFGKTKYGKLKILCWHQKNNITPREIIKGTHRKFFSDVPSVVIYLKRHLKK